MLQNMLKNKLLAHDSKSYDGYKLTFLGYDFLALRTFVQRGFLSGVGMRIGVGKESDIHVCQGEDGKTYALKLHRLGRVSFRSVKNKRDYLQHRQHASWQYLSRLAAKKEFAYLQALYKEGFPVPVPVDCNRHAVLMEFVNAKPMIQLRTLRDPVAVGERMIKLLLRFAQAGLIHGDFNEFNLMYNDDTEELIVIDFPQVVSIEHPNGEMYFERDVACVGDFLRRKFSVLFETNLNYAAALAAFRANAAPNPTPPVVQASGYPQKDGAAAAPKPTRLEVKGFSSADDAALLKAHESNFTPAKAGEEGEEAEEGDEGSEEEESEEEEEEEEVVVPGPNRDLSWIGSKAFVKVEVVPLGSDEDAAAGDEAAGGSGDESDSCETDSDEDEDQTDEKARQGSYGPKAPKRVELGHVLRVKRRPRGDADAIKRAAATQRNKANATRSSNAGKQRNTRKNRNEIKSHLEDGP